MSDQSRINNAITLIARLSIDKSSRTLSKFVRAGARIELERAYVVDVSEATKVIAHGESEVVGALVNLTGDAPFKFLFFVGLKDSFLLADLILRRPLGTTTGFDLYASSAVQEIGNVLATSISNVFATDFQIVMRSTPPMVLHDYAGTLFEEYILEAAVEKNELFIIETKFFVVEHNINCHMFIVPLHGSEDVLSSIANRM